MSILKIYAYILTCVVTIPASAETFEDMRGKSILVEYSENATREGDLPHQITQTQKIYFSNTGQVFLRLQYHDKFGQGGSETSASSFDTVGDRDGVGQTHRTNYRWEGAGLTRSWRVNGGGMQFVESISISNGRCAFSRERSSASVRVEVIHNNCRIVEGNILAR